MDMIEELNMTISILQVQRNAAADLQARTAVLMNIAQKEVEKIREELVAAQSRIVELEGRSTVSVVTDHLDYADE